MKAKRYNSFLFFIGSVFFSELVVKISSFEKLQFKGLLYTFLFSVPIGVLIGLICYLWKPKVNRRLAIIFSVALFLIFCTQAVYYNIFKTFLTLYSASGAGAVLQYWREALVGIFSSLGTLIILAIPLVLVSVFRKRIFPDMIINPKPAVLIVLLSVLWQLLTVILCINSTSGVLPVGYIYREAFVPNLSVSTFGVLTTLRLDIKYLLLGNNFDSVPTPSAQESPNASPSPSSPSPSPSPSESTPPATPTPIVYGDNIIEIDFEALMASNTNKQISEMHEYFSAVKPTKQNEYTGMFKGKNLIWIVAEAFSSLALNEEVTPTLYKLSREGFVFNNFYNPVWGVSTSDGEYVTCTGLIPKSGVWSFYRSASISLPFTFGHQMGALGYVTKAYHNHDYTYYHRDASHPNMGYEYKGVGNGLNVKKSWPESDLEMMQVTTPEYMDSQPFHTYYMTVSGHLNYSFNGNYIASKNREAVSHLDYSEAARAYLACNIEFDLSMKYLIEQLEEAGILDDTVIVISGDHYPYGLTQEQMEELAGHDIEKNFELYRSTLIIWNSAMETVEIDKECSALDILPTISNLMGVEYDSRLLMGTDILSDSDPLVIFSNRSWITDKGRYNSTVDSFKIDEGATVEDGYARRIVSAVNDKFKFSAKILETDYYSHVLQTSGQ